jgi:FkbM family methyltransferase
MEYFGTEYGGWPVLNSQLNSDSVVLSFGLGEDISFDLGVIERFGCRVVGFDPTPKSAGWLKKQELPTQFGYVNVGLAGENGVITFNAPADPDFASYSTVHATNGGQKIELPVKDLETIAREHSIDKIDVLKMDIEGSENAVIETLLGSRIRPVQILVEFHHRIHNTEFARTRKAINTLEGIGYRLFYISNLGDEFAFVHESALTN